MEYKYLGKINSPSDLKKLNIEQLGELCGEIRDCILKTVSKNGGHLASNLGAVEMTVAIHYVFNSPDDGIVFDVGHQCYTHKLLTGRYEDFSTLRTENGISGFMRPGESPHDPFVTGHSSTAISSAYGLLKGRELTGTHGSVIAVVGDGAMTGGMAYEAMNNAGRDKKNLIIILNDNKMSISKNVGAFARYLNIIRQKRSYFNLKRDVKAFLSHIPLIGPAIKSKISRSKDRLKHRIYYNSNIFEGFGFKYFGPVDGHDLEKLIEMLRLVKKEERPVVLHITTVKGKGYEPAENAPNLYHGVSGFDLEKGVDTKKKHDFSAAFGETLCEAAKRDDRVCAVTAAMPDGTGLDGFKSEFPRRFFDVGISEEHAVTFCAGLAKAGMKPFFAVYSSFIQRGIDQVIHDTAIAGLPVVFCIDRAGFVGADGETHQGLYDIPLLTAVPGITVYSPANYGELRKIINLCLDAKSPCVIRYPRGCEDKNIADLDFDGDLSVFGSSDTAAVTFGREFSNVYEAMNNTGGFETVKLNRVFPLAEGLADRLLAKKRIVFFEESSESGGIGEKVAALLCEKGYKGSFKTVAVNGFVPAATQKRDDEIFGLDMGSVEKIMSDGELKI